MKLYPAKKYKIEYASGIMLNFSEFDTILNLFRNSDSVYISEDENEMEIDFPELQGMIAQTKDERIRYILQYIYDNCDKSNDFAHICI